MIRPLMLSNVAGPIPATGGVLVDICGAAHLLHLAKVEDRNAVAHGQGFFLIMGHEDKRYPDPLLDVFQLHLHFLPQFQIKGTEWLIQQQHAGLIDQCPRQSNSLALAPG